MWISDALDVPLDSIKESFWASIDSQIDPSGRDSAAVLRAVDVARTKRNPVGYFQKILPQFIEERAA
jgi:hypothetical protein